MEENRFVKKSPAVVLKNLSYTYPGGRGVSKCTLTVPRGSIYGLLGFNDRDFTR